MKKLFTILALAFATQAFAQDARKSAEDMQDKVAKPGEMKEGWTKGGILSANLNHTSNDSWQGASEKYTLAVNGSVNYFAYRKWDKNLWKNDLMAAYGVIQSPSTYRKFRKNDDRLNLSSLFARQIKNSLYGAAALDVITQMTPSYNYASPTAFDTSSSGIIKPTKFVKTSNFLTPGVIRLGIGALWQPRTNLSIYLSPLTTNISTKLDKDFLNVAFNNVDAGKKVNFGLGALLRADYFTTINKQFTYKTRFVAFTDYLNRPFDKIDLDWNNSLIFNATKFIGVKLDVNFRYYEGQIQRLQVLEMLGVGFAYKF